MNWIIWVLFIVFIYIAFFSSYKEGFGRRRWLRRGGGWRYPRAWAPYYGYNRPWWNRYRRPWVVY